MKLFIPIGLLAWTTGFAAVPAFPSDTPGAAASWPLAAEAKVDSQGIFLKNLVSPQFREALPHLRLGDAPAFGRNLVWTRAQISEAVVKAMPDLAAPVWAGPEKIKITRRSRLLDETELRQLLTTALQKDYVRERGELELRLARPWISLAIPDEPLLLRIVDMPANGVSANFITRCELKAGEDNVGAFQLTVSARVWRDLWVARSAVLRGQLLAAADLGQERRDILAFKDGLATLPVEDPNYEIAENLAGGTVLTARSLRQRPVFRRGKTLDALIQEGALTIVVKVEALEDGLPGQSVRVRNLKSRREFRGKVQDEQTITVQL